MSDLLKKVAVAIFVLWLPFALASLASIVVGLIAVFRDDEPYAKDILRAQDKLAAALFGWGGANTVSAECGSRQAGCAFCRFVCRVLDLIQPGHCKGAAKHEGLS